jgi:hypothetical protein
LRSAIQSGRNVLRIQQVRRAFVRREWRRNSSMSQAKRASREKRPSRSVSVLGIAGMSLAASTGGSPADVRPASLAPTAASVADTLWQNVAPFKLPAFDDEEISGVSLATFHLFDKENPGNSWSGIQLAFRAGGGCGCGHGCGGCGGARGCGGGVRGCRVGGCGAGGCRGCRVGGCGVGWGGCGGCGCGGGCGGGWGWGGGCCLSWGGCGLC